MSKKLIFRIILSFICVFGFQYDAHAEWGCTDDNSEYASAHCGCKPVKEGGSHMTCSDNYGNHFEFCDCSDCDDNYYKEWYTFTNFPSSSDYWNYGDGANKCVPSCSTSEPCPSGYTDGGSTYNQCNGQSINSCYKKCDIPCSCPEGETCEYSTTEGRDYYDENGDNKCEGTPDSCEVITKECESGYYGDGNTCTQCPLADGIYTNSARTSDYQARYTSNKGATSVYDCYLPYGETYYDTIGSFTFGNTCEYE